MHPLTKPLLLVTLLLLLAVGSYAQQVSCTISYKKAQAIIPDSGAQVYLCRTTKELGIDRNKIRLREEVMKAYECSLHGTARQMAKRRQALADSYGIITAADTARYIADATAEEAKITTAQGVLVSVTDGKGSCSFAHVAEGNYILFIRSANSLWPLVFQFDVADNIQTHIDHVIEP